MKVFAVFVIIVIAVVIVVVVAVVVAVSDVSSPSTSVSRYEYIKPTISLSYRHFSLGNLNSFLTAISCCIYLCEHDFFRCG
jgi:hypothetical protein